MSAYALEKTNIPQRDSPLPPPNTWHTQYEFEDDTPKTVQFEPKSPKPKETVEETALVEPKTHVSLLPTQDDLPSCDGVPMETERHRLQMELLINSLQPWLGEQGYVSGNMFVYFSAKQLKNQDFKGPDVFVVRGVSNQERKSWVVWEEGKTPDIVIELLSDTTAKEDKNNKKQIYQDKLRVPEYFWFDPHNSDDFQGFGLSGTVYKELPFKNEGFTSQALGLKLILWRGIYKHVDTVWLRWATLNGDLLLLPEEAEAKRAETEAQRARTAEQRAEAESQRARAAEQRAERLAQLLREQGIDPDKE